MKEKTEIISNYGHENEWDEMDSLRMLPWAEDTRMISATLLMLTPALYGWLKRFSFEW